MQNQPVKPPASPPPHSPISSLKPVNSSDSEEKKPKKFILIILIILAIALGATGGVFGYQYIQKQKLFQTQPSPTPVVQQPSPSPDPTAGWETYSSEFQNITFKYPPSWEITEKEGQKVGENIYNTKILLSKNEAIITMYLNMDGLGGKGQTYEGREFILDGNHLYQYTRHNENSTKIGLSTSLVNTLGVFEINNTTYSITLTYPNTYTKKESSPILNEFNQILSTFKFIDEDDETDGLETYENLEQGISFKYPSNYTQPPQNSNPAPGIFYLSIISPLLPSVPKITTLRDGELKVEIYISPSQQNDSLDKFVSDQVGESKTLSLTSTTIDGVQALLRKWEGMGDGETIFAIYKGKRITIAKYPLQTNQQDEFNQILSTFKFLD